MAKMMMIRWWVAAIAVPFVLAVGVFFGYFLKDVLRLIEQPATVSLNVPARVAEPPSPGRDPFMEAGARFMARVTEFKERVERDPTDLEALIFLGNANYDITRFDQAAYYYEKALEIDSTNIHIRTDLATSYYKTGDVDRALTEIQASLQQVPDHETALYNLGIILLRKKNDRLGAIEAWKKLLESNPDSALATGLREKIEEIKSQGK